MSYMTSNTKLYKYLDVKGGLSMLHYSNLQFTNSTRLNDPFDCHPALFDFSKVPDRWDDKVLREFFKEKGENDTENLRNRAWICSLSKLHDSVPLWAYYAKHKGVCIGVNMEKARKYLSSIRCGIITGALEMEVQYRDVVEKPDYFCNEVDYYRYLLSTKAKAWEHEQEVRLVLIEPIPAWSNNNPFYAPMGLPYKTKRKEVIDWKEVRAYPHLGGECFESLYLGIKIDEKDKTRIIQEAKKCNPIIEIYQMTIDPDAFRLKEELITEFSMNTAPKERILSIFRKKR